MKYSLSFWSILFLIATFLILNFTANRDVLAKFLWQKYHWPITAILLDRNNTDLAMFIGNYYFNGVTGSREYNPDIAFKAYQKAVSIKPGILWGHYQLARVYFIKGSFGKAIEEIDKELKYNPENLRSLYVRGLIYGYRNSSGDLEKAENDFRRFTEWAPKEWAGYNDLAWVLSKQGKYLEAKADVLKAFRGISDAATNPWLWNALGVAQLNLKKYYDAADSFKKAKNLAEKLTIEEWRLSYPGNDPAAGGEGLSAFLKAIGENLSRSEAGIKN